MKKDENMEICIVYKKLICSTYHIDAKEQYYYFQCFKSFNMYSNDKQLAKSNYNKSIE